MNIQEYREGRYFLYRKFCLVIKGILEEVIPLDKFNLQQIQFRAKDPNSLEKKLENNNISNPNDIENEVKDIAGCRLIFYYDSDISKLKNSGVIWGAFEVVDDGVKIHNKVGEVKNANEYYTAVHYVVKLTQERLQLPEFTKFEGLQCEIQVQTVLNHAWSETAHDVIYKPSMPFGYGSQAMKSIDTRLQKIMKDYLIPAGDEFEKVRKDHQSLIKGKEIYKGGVLKRLIACNNNNERYVIIEHYKNNVLSHINDYKIAEDEVFNVVAEGIKLSRNVDVINIETKYGVIGGKTPHEVFKVCIEILKYIRYLNIPRLQSVLFDIFKVSISDKEKKEVAEFIGELSAYDIGVFNEIGLSTQTTLINIVKNYSDDELKIYNELIISIAGAVLKPYAEGITWKYDAVTLKYASLPASEKLNDLREKAINILMRLYKIHEDGELLSTVSDAMLKSTETPRRDIYSDDLLKIILKNTLSYIGFVKDVGLDAQFYYLVPLEAEVERLYARSHSALEKGCSDVDLVNLNNEIVHNSIEFRDLVNNNDKYLKYKCLVDFRSVFVGDSGSRKSPLERKDFLDNKVSEYVEAVSEDNFEGWKDNLEQFCEIKSDDRNMFQYLDDFARSLAQNKPDIVIRLIEESGNKVATIMGSLLKGLLLSGNNEFVYKKMREDIAKSHNCHIHAKLFMLNKNIDRDILKLLLEKSIENDDKWGAIQVVSAVVYGVSIYKDSEIDNIFIPAIKYLTEKEDANWVYQIRFKDDNNLLIQNLKPEYINIVLNNLVYLSDIRDDAEYVLKPVAEKYPDKVIRLFKSRLEYEDSGDAPALYISIPFEFYELHNELSKYPDICVDEVFSWYEEYKDLFTYRVANLIKNIFPEFSPGLEAKLIAIVGTGDVESIKIILAVLWTYQGQAFLHNTCLAIVKTLDKGHDLLDEVKIILRATGLVSGEYGFVELFQNKINQIEHWKNSENDNVVEFTHSYIKELENRVKAEQRRADQSVAAAKLEYD